MLIITTILLGINICMSICVFFSWLYWTLHCANNKHFKSEDDIQNDFEHNLFFTFIVSILWSVFYYLTTN